jgi:squalene-associated FAD-dependent desaturase
VDRVEDGARPLKRTRVAVIGGGYAGMAAAVALVDAGIETVVYEAGQDLGGRARRIEHRGTVLDNGLHIGIGAYTSLLAITRQVRAAGGDAGDGWQRRPLEWFIHGGLRLQAPRLPAPLHLAAALATARGLPVRARWDAIRLIGALRRNGYRIGTDITVDALLDRHRQGRPITDGLWAPLCIAALNTPPGRASAQVFANVLRDSLGASRTASDLLLPATDLSALFPDPAAQYVAAKGGAVYRGHRVTRIEAAGHGAGWQLAFAPPRAESAGPFEALVLAVAPRALADLTARWPALQPVHAKVGAYAFEPITSVYLQYGRTVRLPRPMTGMAEGPGQWVFDRGLLTGQAGLLGVVISASAAQLASERMPLADAVHRQLCGLLPGLPAPAWSKVITEKQATFSCTPGLERPATVTAEPGIVLAGDHVASDYPATLEGAVRSGLQAADAVVARMRRG